MCNICVTLSYVRHVRKDNLINFFGGRFRFAFKSGSGMPTCIYMLLYERNHFKNVYYLSHKKLIFCNKDVYDVPFFLP